MREISSSSTDGTGQSGFESLSSQPLNPRNPSSEGGAGAENTPKFTGGSQNAAGSDVNPVSSFGSGPLQGGEGFEALRAVGVPEPGHLANGPRPRPGYATGGVDMPVQATGTRFCGYSWDDAEGDTEHCTAVLSDGLNCTVCAGRRCYEHCGSVDHFEGAIPLGGGTRGTLTWEAVQVGRSFHGHVAAVGGLVIAKFSNVTRDGLMAEMGRALGGKGQGMPAFVEPSILEADPGQGEPDADLPAHDHGGGAPLHMTINVPARLDGRHQRLLKLLVADVLDPLGEMSEDFLGALAALAHYRGGAQAIETVVAWLRAPDRAAEMLIELDAARAAAAFVGYARGCGCAECRKVLGVLGVSR